jgi:transaldolase
MLLRAAGQRLWLDTISRRLLESGTLQRYIDLYGLSGVTSNPTILSRELAEDAREYGPSRTFTADDDPEALVLAEAVENVQRAGDLFRPQWDATNGDDGWVSIEVSPALADLGADTVREGIRLHSQVDRPNVFIKVPATPQGALAIEELTVAGVPVNATLIFDVAQHRLVEESYLRGLERRITMGLAPDVASVASVFVSRWDQATNPQLPDRWQNWAGLSAAHEIHEDHSLTLSTPRWDHLAKAGANAQRIVWASTAVKDATLPATYYAARLPTDGTINTMPESTLLAVADHESLQLITTGQPSARTVSRALAESSVDQHQVAESLQQEGVARFAADWLRLLESAGAAGPASGRGVA